MVVLVMVKNTKANRTKALEKGFVWWADNFSDITVVSKYELTAAHAYAHPGEELRYNNACLFFTRKEAREFARVRNLTLALRRKNSLKSQIAKLDAKIALMSSKNRSVQLVSVLW